MELQKWQSDERRFNSRGGPSTHHKVRVIVGQKAKPIAYGVTLPFEIASQFSGCQLKICVSGTCIVMESGCKL